MLDKLAVLPAVDSDDGQDLELIETLAHEPAGFRLALYLNRLAASA
jgi:hypothetical protein